MERLCARAVLRYRIFSSAAFPTEAINLLSVGEHLEIKLPADLFLNLFNVGIVKLDNSAAFQADKMVVVGVTQDMLIGAAPLTEIHLTHQIAAHQ